MLVLMRTEEESIVLTVGDTRIEVIIVGVKNRSRKHIYGQVQVGIDAPPEVKVLRKELEEQEPYRTERPAHWT